MRSLNRIAGRSIALPLSADDIIEFHLARLLLLLKFCGTAGRIDGLTKMAKLDFFARYPDFFSVAKAAVAKDEGESEPLSPSATHTVESAMVMQEIPASVQSTINSINSELRKSNVASRKKSNESASTGSVVRSRRKPFARVTPNDTKSPKGGSVHLPAYA